MTVTKLRGALALVVLVLLVAATVLELPWLIAVVVVTIGAALSWERRHSRRHGDLMPSERDGR